MGQKSKVKNSPSLPHSLTPSLPHSLTPSLPHSLTPSLPLSLNPISLLHRSNLAGVYRGRELVSQLADRSREMLAPQRSLFDLVPASLH